MGHFEQRSDDQHIELRSTHGFSICPECTQTIPAHFGVCTSCGFNPDTGRHVELWRLNPNTVLADDPAILTYAEIRTGEQNIKLEDIFLKEVKGPWIRPLTTNIVLTAATMFTLVVMGAPVWVIVLAAGAVAAVAALAGTWWSRRQTYTIKLYTLTGEDVRVQGSRRAILEFWEKLDEVLTLRASQDPEVSRA